MNTNHDLCSSPEWAAYLQSTVLPQLVRDVDLGATMLEVGPGPGAATQWLRERVAALTAVESDREAAALLAAAYEGTNVEVIEGDASDLAFGDATFDSAGMFTMLHHVATAAQQNALLGEVLRVLHPGGALVGSDSLASNRLHHFHEADTYNPIEPGTLLTRLQTLGYDRITVGVHDTLTFIAHKPDVVAADED